MNASASSKVSALTEISIFTEGDDLPLADVFTNIYNHTGGKEAISHKEAPEKLKAASRRYCPTTTATACMCRDMKKVFMWYNILLGAGFTEFKLPETEEE